MSQHWREIAFTPAVADEQERQGSRDRYAGRTSPEPDRLGAAERAFLAERDGFSLASVGETGWPYVQHRGGPPGFLRVLDDATLGWADFRGNLQHVTTGNLTGDDRVALLVVDHARRRRLKVFGRARVTTDPAVLARLTDPAYDAVVQRAVLVAVEGLDWNCPQHIVPRFSAAELAPLHARLRALEEENAALRAAARA